LRTEKIKELNQNIKREEFIETS